MSSGLPVGFTEGIAGYTEEKRRRRCRKQTKAGRKQRHQRRM
ncbi:MAG: hypothetical protein SPI30_05395 [Prevotella sp.]|nr:hypothetical protein [Prevotella sp.]